MFRTIFMLTGLGLITVGRALLVQEVRRFERIYSRDLRSFNKDMAGTAMSLHWAVSAGCYSVQLLGLVLVIFGIFDLGVLTVL